jgi:hypothetical protein
MSAKKAMGIMAWRKAREENMDAAAAGAGRAGVK